MKNKILELYYQGKSNVTIAKELIRFRWTNVIKNKDQTIQQLRQFIDLN